jgi:D-alanine-D-alanine ligase
LGRSPQTALERLQALDCQGYARVDLRVDENEIPYIIEVNCNPDLSPEAGFYQAARRAGYTYAEMALRILQMASTGNQLSMEGSNITLL